MRKNAFTLAEGATHVGIFHNTRRVAFTLAEVLITLGIIGVVATLTLPNVMSNYAKKSQVTQLQRTVNAISSAAANYMLENKVDSLAESNFANDLDSFFKDYLGCISVIDNTKAFTASYKNMHGSSSLGSNINADAKCGKLPTGATICIFPDANKTDGYWVNADVNGNSAPNVDGRDVFGFTLSYKGRIIANTEDEYCGVNNDQNPQLEYSSCFTKIMNDGWEMNY